MFGQSGQQSSNLFGQQKPSIFGTTNQTVSMSPFNSSTGTQQQSTALSGSGIFGAKSGFGQTTQQTSSLFSKPSSGFGTTTGSSFSFGGTSAQQPTSSLFAQASSQSALVPYNTPGTAVKFDPPKAAESVAKNGETKQINTKHMCISAMKHYETKSMEELRVEDYLANRKLSTPSAGLQLFGQPQTQQPTFGLPQAPGAALFGITQQKPAVSGIFGSTAGTSSFNITTTTTQQPAIFGATQPVQTSSLFQQPKTTSIFGSTQQSPFGGTSGITQTSQPSTIGSLFPIKPFSTQTNQPGLTGGIFGQQQQPATSLFQTQTSTFPFTTTTMTQPGTTSFFQSGLNKPGALFPTTTSTFPPLTTQPLNLFGSTALTTTTPSIFSNFSKPSVFPSTTTTTTTGGLFQTQPIFGGSLMTGGDKSIFGQQTQPGAAFATTLGSQQLFTGTGTGPLSALGANSSVSPPILLGTNINVSSMQQAILDAQLSALPYGDSPLLKAVPLSPENKHLQSPETLQRKLRFLNSKEMLSTPSVCTNVYTGEKNLDISSILSEGRSGSSLRTSVQDRDRTLSTDNLDRISLKYNPLVLLPSVGFGASLGLDTSRQKSYFGPPKSLKSETFFTKPPNMSLDSTGLRRIDGSPRVKNLDLSAIDNENRRIPRIRPSVSPDSTTDFHDASNNHSHQSSSRPDENNSNAQVYAESLLATSTIISSEKNLPKSTNSSPPSPPAKEQRPPAVTTTPTSSSSATIQLSSLPPQLSVKGVQLTRPEYYCEPSVETLNQSIKDGVCHIESGLTIGRIGYGSVFWRGPFDLHYFDFDQIIHFRSKEIIVYPDETTKPSVGDELNRPAEVSLDRIWPVDQNRQLITDPEKLQQLSFRDKLERLCLRMGSVFRDYQPATGTWQFSVQHFSKYGFIDDEVDVDSSYVSTGDDYPVITTDQQEQLRNQINLQSLIQRAGIPLHEIQRVQNGFAGDRNSNNVQQYNKIDLSQTQSKRILKSELIDDIDAELVNCSTNGYVSGDTKSTVRFSNGGTVAPDSSNFFSGIKKGRFDDALIESSKLLDRVSLKTATEGERKKRCLIERLPKNHFKGLTSAMLSQSVLRMSVQKHSNFSLGTQRPSSRVSFSKDLMICSFSPNSFLTSVNISKIYPVPTVMSFLIGYLRSINSLHLFDSLGLTELLRFDPPSTLIRLLDSFITQSHKESRNNLLPEDDAIQTLCSILFGPYTDDHKSLILQRMKMGEWIRDRLSKKDANLNSDDPFSPIYCHLINGRLDEAIDCAKNSRFYNLGLIISMFKMPTSSLIRENLSKQLKLKNYSPNSFYEKILKLLCTRWANDPTDRNCMTGLNWLQKLGIIIWYWSRTSTTLLQCIRVFDNIEESC